MTKFLKGIAVGLVCLFGAVEAKAEVSFSKVWARTSTGPNGAAYGTFKSMAGDRLISAESPVCEYVELHTHIHEGAIKRMRKVELIDIPAGETVMLKPGGLHIMLMKLNTDLAEGDQVPLTLTFEKAGVVELIAPVKKKGPCCGGKEAHASVPKATVEKTEGTCCGGCKHKEPQTHASSEPKASDSHKEAA
ncbi:MAG: copper chaperone PCu(A)C [bacterium]|nr:copper chaperone PCu(A)C [bacterium]